MQLSEAIRLGAMLKPQAYTHPRDQVRISEQPSTCALAAAAEACGMEELNVFSDVWESHFGNWSQQPSARCPAGGCDSADVLIVIGSVVTHLNDHHKWTREQIADWVATVEAALSTTSNGTLNGDAVPVRPTEQMNVCSRQDAVLVSEPV